MKRKPGRRRRVAAAALLCVLARVISAGAQTPRDIPDLSFENLPEIRVTTTSKQRLKVADTAAAVFVITQDDIQKFGFTSVPEALRLVPGLDVARISANTWAIQARGLQQQFSGQMLVLVDGRTVYSPTFAAVLGDIPGVSIENIDRIEVVRSLGGVLWGANAINGVIHIITKPAGLTPGGLFVSGWGNEERRLSFFRWGGDFGSHGSYRFSGKTFSRNPLGGVGSGQSHNDRSHSASIEFRTDWASGADHFATSGSFYKTEMELLGTPVRPVPPADAADAEDTATRGGYVGGRWSHQLSETSGFDTQLSQQEATVQNPPGNDHWRMLDFDFQHHLDLGSKQNVLWGFGYRRVISGFSTTTLHSLFGQDNFGIGPHLRLTLGAKIEETTDQKMHFLPQVRLLWSPTPKHTVWAGAAHASSDESQIHRDGYRDEGYESGYRYRPSNRFFIDIANFYNSYNNLRIPDFQANVGRGAETFGTELAAAFSARKKWKTGGSYSFVKMQVHKDPLGGNAETVPAEGTGPMHQFQFRNSYNIARNVSLNSALYIIGSRRAFHIPSYSRLDLHMNWDFSDQGSLSVTLQNAIGSPQREFADPAIPQTTLIGASAHIKFIWHF